MNRDEFCKYHWQYYLLLERDFLKVEPYVSFELGDNYLYDGIKHKNLGNSKIYSDEFVKQYLAIGSEVDVILKTICKELGNSTAKSMDEGYTPTILKKWNDISEQKVKIGEIELQPFMNWKMHPQYKAPGWWGSYNAVKHNRIKNYQKANLKNVMNALAGLYILEQYLARYIGKRDGSMDVPNDISRLFEIINFSTNNEVLGRNMYGITKEEIEAMFE